MTHGSVLLDESRRHSRWHICRRQARRPDRKTAYRHPGRCVVLLVAAAAGLGACGGSSSPHVASLGKSGGISGKSGITSTTVGSVNPTQLLDEWAICLRSHSDPDQVD